MKQIFYVLGLIAILNLTACGEKMEEDTGLPASSQTPNLTDPSWNTPSANGNGSGTLNPPALNGLNNPSAASNVGAQIKAYYDQYLPNCYTPARAAAWQQWFNNGGKMEDFVSTLRIVATATRCSNEGQEITTDPHYIKGYYDYYLPGCYDASKQAYWSAWFANGGTDADFRITLHRVATQERPACSAR